MSDASLAAPTPQLSRRMPELDGIRGIAVLLVISFHAWYNLRWVFETKQQFIEFASSIPWYLRYTVRGDLAVDTFFVLSGFLLSWQLFSQRIATGHLNYRVYFAHRVFRIYPLYLVGLAIAFAIQPTWMVLGNLFAFNIWLGLDHIVVPWTWTISVELHFYLVIPFLILLITGWRSLLLVTLFTCGVAAVWTFWFFDTNPALMEQTLSDLLLAGEDDLLDAFFRDYYVAVPARLCEFLFGTIAAWLISYRYSHMTRLAPGMVALITILAVAAMLQPALHNPFVPQTEWNRTFMHWDFWIGRFTFPAGAAALITLMLSGHLEGLRRALSIRFLKAAAKYTKGNRPPPARCIILACRGRLCRRRDPGDAPGYGYLEIHRATGHRLRQAALRQLNCRARIAPFRPL